MAGPSIKFHFHETSPGTSTWIPNISGAGTLATGDLVSISISTDSSTNLVTGVAGLTGSVIQVSNANGTGSKTIVTGKWASSNPVLTLSSAWGAGHAQMAIEVLDKTIYSDFGTLGTFGTRGASSNTITAPAAGSSAAPNLVYFFEKTTSETSCTTSGVTDIENLLPTTGVAGAMCVSGVDNSGGTAAKTATYALSSANGAGVQLPLVLAVSNVAPTAAFTSSVVGMKVSVDGTGSSDSDGTVASYDWDWGDGTTHGTGSTTNHTYTSAGSFTVKLTVTDNLGATGNVSHTVNVNTTGQAVTIRTSGGTNQPGKMFYFDGTTRRDFSTTLIEQFKPCTVTEFLSPLRSPWFAAHRGSSNNYPEETLYGYRGSTDAGYKAIEISVNYSLDGTPWCFHDAYLDRTVLSGNPSSTTLQISAMHDTAIAAYSNNAGTASLNTGQPSQPVAKLTDVLAIYAATHVIIIEDKSYSNTTAILNLMDSYGTSGRLASDIFIWKVAYGSAKATFFDPAASRGYHRWAYIFDANMAADMTALAASGKADMIGMDYNSSDATLTSGIAACVANGVMPTGHIIPTSTQRDRLLGLGMKGLMMSNKLILPRTW